MNKLFAELSSKTSFFNKNSETLNQGRTEPSASSTASPDSLVLESISSKASAWAAATKPFLQDVSANITGLSETFQGLLGTAKKTYSDFVENRDSQQIKRNQLIQNSTDILNEMSQAQANVNSGLSWVQSIDTTQYRSDVLLKKNIYKQDLLDIKQDLICWVGNVKEILRRSKEENIDELSGEIQKIKDDLADLLKELQEKTNLFADFLNSGYQTPVPMDERLALRDITCQQTNGQEFRGKNFDIYKNWLIILQDTAVSRNDDARAAYSILCRSKKQLIQCAGRYKLLQNPCRDLKIQDKNRKLYIDQVESNNVWISELELDLLAKVFDIELTIWTRNADQYQKYSGGRIGAIDSKAKHHLLLSNGNHYEVLLFDQKNMQSTLLVKHAAVIATPDNGNCGYSSIAQVVFGQQSDEVVANLRRITGICLRKEKYQESLNSVITALLINQ